jgi:hypothetical protein
MEGVYSRPSSLYTGNTWEEKFFNSTAANRNNLGLFFWDCYRWYSEYNLAAANWETIVTSGHTAVPTWFQSNLASPTKVIRAIGEHFMRDRFMHYVLYFFVGIFGGSVGPASVDSGKLIWLCLWWVILGLSLFSLMMSNLLCPHFGAPQSCVACAGVYGMITP